MRNACKDNFSFQHRMSLLGLNLSSLENNKNKAQKKKNKNKRKGRSKRKKYGKSFTNKCQGQTKQLANILNVNPTHINIWSSNPNT